MGEAKTSGVLLMARLDKERITARMHTNDTEALLRFNVTKQRIVEICNRDFEDDPFDEAKDYSTWNRALNGKEVWEGIVASIDSLMTDQTAHPRKYLPDAGPPKVDLHLWMKQIGGATWWRDVLCFSASQSTFNAWFSGRPMASDKVAEVKDAVDQWWSKVMYACERAEYASLGRELCEASYRERHAHGLASYFYTKVIEEGLDVDNARCLFVDLHDKAFRHHTRLIDLSDPVDPLVPFESVHSDLLRREYGTKFDEMHAQGYPDAIPKGPPPFDPQPWYVDSKWGDRRDEECPKDLNECLYGLWYRSKHRHVWNEQERRLELVSEIVEVSPDGETWLPANERQKQGWDPGTFFFMKHLHETGETPVNAYTRERQEVEAKIRDIKGKIERSGNTSGDVASLLAELTSSYREIETLNS